MDQGLLTALVGAGVAVLLVLLVVLVPLLRTGRRTRAELAASRADLAGLRAEVDGLRAAASRAELEPRPVHEQEFVITTLPDGTTPAQTAVPDDERLPVRQLRAGEFASVALGESMVRLVSLGYGVRRALSAENRNRIRFEMRREVKRARKQRRRDLKEAKRHLRAEHDDVDRRAA
jgi:type II secretory pathway pseudopilin PulG